MPEQTDIRAVYLRLPADLYARVERAAARAGYERGRPVSVPEWCRAAIDRALEQEPDHDE
mgnify:CR=1 FL=1